MKVSKSGEREREKGESGSKSEHFPYHVLFPSKNLTRWGADGFFCRISSTSLEGASIFSPFTVIPLGGIFGSITCT